MSSFRPSILREPRWILAIVVAGVLVVGFVRLGLWQLDRLEQRRASNALIELRESEPPRPLEALLSQYGTDPENLIYRQAIVTGRYRTVDEFFSVGRRFDDVSGTMVLTPFELADGSTMIVVRGLVPTDTPGPPAHGYAPPSGVVAVVGRIDDGEEPLRIGEPDPDDGVLRSISRVDLEYIDTWLDGGVLPISLTVSEQVPSVGEDQLFLVPREELSEGRHLGYAVQWFAFAIIVAVGVAVLIRRSGSSDITEQVDPEPARHE
ncbi:MAG: SURF1 family protein [Acidimicrobiia bacterium]|nr:MAG: SURF1 family protein [Acidimicrobiia bacterium]